MDYMICSAPEVSDGCFDPEDLPQLFRRVSVLEEGFAQMNEVVQCMGRKLAPTPSQPVEHDQNIMRTEDKMCPKNGQLVEQACQISDLQHEFQQTFEKLRQEFVASMDPQGLHRELESMVGRVATDIQEMYSSEVGCLRTEVEQLATEFRHEVARRSNSTDSIGISQDVSQTSQEAQGETEKLQQEITRSIKQMRENVCAEISTSITQMRDEQEAKMCAISAALAGELAGVEERVQKFQQDLEGKVVGEDKSWGKMKEGECRGGCGFYPGPHGYCSLCSVGKGPKFPGGKPPESAEEARDMLREDISGIFEALQAFRPNLNRQLALQKMVKPKFYGEYGDIL